MIYYIFVSSDLSKFEDGIGEKVPLFIILQATFVSALTLALIKGWELALICLISLPVSLITVGIISFVGINLLTNIPVFYTDTTKLSKIKVAFQINFYFTHISS